MSNAMNLKAMVKKISKEKNISAQLILQNYMLERILERISQSAYRENLILKGGFLIASMVGVDTRATMDMDITIKGKPANESFVENMFKEILKIPLQDNIEFEFKSIGRIRESDEYSGYRIGLVGLYPPMAIPLKLDVTTGDRITPKEIEFNYKLMLEDKSIPIFAYNLETILSEKLEAILSRGDQTTRPRDYYDVFILCKLQNNNINLQYLSKGICATADKRGTLSLIKEYEHIIEICKSSNTMKEHWKKYQKSFTYAAHIPFEDTCDAVVALMNQLEF